MPKVTAGRRRRFVSGLGLDCVDAGESREISLSTSQSSQSAWEENELAGLTSGPIPWSPRSSSLSAHYSPIVHRTRKVSFEGSHSPLLPSLTSKRNGTKEVFSCREGLLDSNAFQSSSSTSDDTKVGILGGSCQHRSFSKLSRSKCSLSLSKTSSCLHDMARNNNELSIHEHGTGVQGGLEEPHFRQSASSSEDTPSSTGTWGQFVDVIPIEDDNCYIQGKPADFIYPFGNSIPRLNSSLSYSKETPNCTKKRFSPYVRISKHNDQARGRHRCRPSEEIQVRKIHRDICVPNLNPRYQTPQSSSISSTDAITRAMRNVHM